MVRRTCLKISALALFSALLLLVDGVVGGEQQQYAEQPAEDVRVVHIAFMTHLDVGFTNFARNVCDTYFDDHFPRAIATAQELRMRGGQERFVYLSHPWLILEYLDNSAQCAHRARTPDEIDLLTQAILDEDVTWHANAFNWFIELADRPFFEWSLSLSSQLNARFNKSWGALAAKHTDVTGMSRSVVAPLQQHGVQALHIGYNAACMLPPLPPVFVWEDEATQSSVVTMVEHSYGQRVSVAGLDQVLLFDFTLDNGAPPNASSVIAFWGKAQAQYPNATIQTSSLDAFAAALAAPSVRSKLPRVKQEIGDSWLYGAPADHAKLAGFRAVRRAIADAQANDRISRSDPHLEAYLRRLIVVPEHNWGLSVSQYLPTLRGVHGNWSNAEFHALRSRPDYADFDREWQEERDFLNPVKAGRLADGREPSAAWLALREELQTTLAELRQPPAPAAAAAGAPSGGGATLPRAEYLCSHFKIAFSPDDGSIVSLKHRESGRQLAGPDNRLGSFLYQTFAEADFDTFNRQYNPGCGPPCGDFAKAGMRAASPTRKDWTPRVAGFRVVGECDFAVELELAAEASAKYGAPRDIELRVTLPAETDSVNITLYWAAKTASRLAEATWLKFSPLVDGPERWRMDVLGGSVSPYDVFINGTRHLHAVWDGVVHTPSAPGQPALRIRSLDAALVAPGDTDHLLRYEGWTQPKCEGGMHFNLQNQLWGTAFPQWDGEPGRFRFVLLPDP